MFSQIPLPPAGAIESWLLSGAAVIAMIALGKKLFVRKPPIEAEFVSKAEFRIFRESVERHLHTLVTDGVEADLALLCHAGLTMQAVTHELGMQAGSMYPILMRLADRGLLETSWETERVAGRPPRHLYRLTGPGLAYATATAAPATEPATAPGVRGPRPTWADA